MPSTSSNSPAPSSQCQLDSHVKEHWLIICDDLNHDYNFVDHCLSNIIMPKLTAIGCRITTLHQRTDGMLASIKANTHLVSLAQVNSTSMSTTSLTIVQVGMAKGKWTKLLDFLKLQQKEQS